MSSLLDDGANNTDIDLVFKGGDINKWPADKPMDGDINSTLALKDINQEEGAVEA